jgi:NAD(P)-dependent dehydrogenase (short-subunit alcohol dehydrogenase family)
MDTCTQPYSNFWEDPEPLENNGYKHVDINVNHPVGISTNLFLTESRLNISIKIKLTRLAIRALLGKNKQGVVAIVGSIAGYSKQYPAPIYSATKHAVVGFTRSLGPAQELQGVKVVCICPG